ncbi:5-oxoprolinase subunit PxpA [Pseudoxanthomonas dokdonensis]|uniref:LamB/YcsF family protein n=1 Tax=Pseudoxanthomonas dokdonensis TaxID=344882 RepID=A0A0R0CTG6_9GAMM|nr:5-oxoprolinase subunit PxpA [Pseudoxanthomonas dokdonensis]KRG68916.1 LamB/YcsF family protein [Pseudoxanthomonas dokdonensis]
MNKPHIDFNCDLGEGIGNDAAILPFVSSANIATGGHAGDDISMRETMLLCLQHGVAIGAHPAYPDREHFGRRELQLAPAEIHATVLAQLRRMADVAGDIDGARLHHVKPHGALYNQAARDPLIAEAIARAVRDHDPRLRLVGLSGSALPAAGQAIGLQVVHEVFAERRYEDDGSLTPRRHADASIDDIELAVQQVQRLLSDSQVLSRQGHLVDVVADSVCLHGDRADAVSFAQQLHAAIVGSGYVISAIGAEH